MREHGLSVHERLGLSCGLLLGCRYFFIQALAVHPTLRLDLQEPILWRGNSAQVFFDMLLSHITDGNLVSVAIHNGYAKQFLRQEDTLGVVAKCPVAEVCEETLSIRRTSYESADSLLL